MTAGDAGPAFSLEYSLEPDDLVDFYANDLKLRRRRGWTACVLVLSTAATVTLTIFFVRGVVNAPGPLKPPLILVNMAVLTGLAVYAGRIYWRLAPSRLARLSLKKTPELRGRHRDDIGPEGVTSTSPDGSKASIPWSLIAGVRETSRQFVLLDGDARARGGLPKRGLHDPALLPALGTYIRNHVGAHPPATDTPGIPTQRSQSSRPQ
jgi:hypothetical protein